MFFPMIIISCRPSFIRSGALHVGDHLLSINGQQLDNQTVEDARRLLAHSSINVILEITPSHNFSERPGISPVEDAVSDTSSRVSHSASVVEHERKVSQCKYLSMHYTCTCFCVSIHVLYMYMFLCEYPSICCTCTSCTCFCVSIHLLYMYLYIFLCEYPCVVHVHVSV